MKDQHPVLIWGCFFLVGIGTAGTLGAMISPPCLFAGLLPGTVLGGVLEAHLAPFRPAVQSLLEHEF